MIQRQFHRIITVFTVKNSCLSPTDPPLLWLCTSYSGHQRVQQLCDVQYCRLPGKAHSSACASGISEDACGDDLTEGLKHALQLLFIY